MTNNKNDLMKWSLISAERNFGVHRSLLKKYLDNARQVPAPDGIYLTMQIIQALKTAMRAERLRLKKDTGGQYRWTDVYAKIGGQWKVVAAHGSLLPKK